MPNPLENKTVVLGVTGSIAAYKAADLASKLTQGGAKVEVVLTPAAEKFITPLTFQSVTGRKAYTDKELWGGEGHVIHIGLAHGTQLLVIAPASANTIAKLARGIGDNLLTVSALAANCPVLIAPAMDAGMFSHPATQENVRILKERGVYFIGPAEGHLASGLVGVGRMSEPAAIYSAARWIVSQHGPLAGKKVVVTAGGTHERIDPVRVITNRSSGKQGYAVAQAALDAGADVTLISTPVSIDPPYGCKFICTESAADMHEAVMQESADADCLIMSAAVADFKPVKPSGEKIKKAASDLLIKLEYTIDILSAVGERRKTSGYPKRVVGFAAESQNLIANAEIKLKAKNLDLIVANDISKPDAGFAVDTNRVIFLYADGRQDRYPLLQKSEVADILIAQVAGWD